MTVPCASPGLRKGDRVGSWRIKRVLDAEKGDYVYEPYREPKMKPARIRMPNKLWVSLQLPWWLWAIPLLFFTAYIANSAYDILNPIEPPTITVNAPVPPTPVPVPPTPVPVPPPIDYSVVIRELQQKHNELDSLIRGFRARIIANENVIELLKRDSHPSTIRRN